MSAPEATTTSRLRGYVVSLGAAEVVGRGLSFVAMIVVARVVGPESFGALALAQAVVLYLAALGDGGLTLWTQREIVRRPHDLPRLLVQTLVAQVLLALVATAVLAAVAFAAPFPGDTSTLILAAAPVALAQALSTVYALQSLEWMRSAAIVKLVTQAVAAGAAVALVLSTRDPVWVIMTMWLGQLAGSALSLAILARGKRIAFASTSIAAVRGTLRAGLPILGALAIVHYSLMIDTVVLGVLRSSHDVGVYAAAARLMVIAVVAALVIANALYPEMVRRHAESDRRLGEFSGRALAIALRLSLAAGALVAAFAPQIVAALYDERFDESATVLRVLALLFPVLCFNSLATQVLLAAGRRGDVLRGVGAGAVVATAAIPTATAALGGVGTACGLVAAMTVQCAALAWLARGDLTTGWRAPLTQEGAVGLVLCGALAAVHTGFPAAPGLLGFTWLTVVLGAEMLRGFPTVGLVLPGVRPRRGRRAR
ncbi:oligosaccharide flippase family protein [Actinokineospora xionganensis]|uniref:Oligosaccharide flippase family protein n=1 Tax=Actinokineospora xionganensis TaxID=2684470 RepID=A0ABR7L670_9PSEU|nr:oligosaccharide flippase family protein [Actinokineospora xionganensis]MBC6447998.1 oligosaccharide flippase family protein [Actinokineospora xionganensis]